jgi:hypothetical protein
MLKVPCSDRYAGKHDESQGKYVKLAISACNRRGSDRDLGARIWLDYLYELSRVSQRDPFRGSVSGRGSINVTVCDSGMYGRLGGYRQATESATKLIRAATPSKTITLECPAPVQLPGDSPERSMTSTPLRIEIREPFARMVSQVLTQYLGLHYHPL